MTTPPREAEKSQKGRGRWLPAVLFLSGIPFAVVSAFVGCVVVAFGAMGNAQVDLVSPATLVILGSGLVAISLFWAAWRIRKN